MSLSELPHGRQTVTNPSVFHLFQSLPWEIQLMIFEEFISATTKEPRIVLMDIEEVELEEGELEEVDLEVDLEASLALEGFEPEDLEELRELAREERDHPEHPYEHGWRFRVGNPGQLHASNPSVVARSLFEVSSASRHVATRFLDQPPETVNPPCFTEALTGLGLSFTSDIFWLLDDFPRLVNIYWDLPSVIERPDEEAEMHSAIVSLPAFEEALDWRGEERDHW